MAGRKARPATPRPATPIRSLLTKHRHGHSGDPTLDGLVGQHARRLGPGHAGGGEPAPDLVRAVAGLLQLGVGHVEDVVDLAAGKMVEEPAVESLVDLADARRAHPVAEPARAHDGDAPHTCGAAEAVAQ